MFSRKDHKFSNLLGAAGLPVLDLKIVTRFRQLHNILWINKLVKSRYFFYNQLVETSGNSQLKTTCSRFSLHTPFLYNETFPDFHFTKTSKKLLHFYLFSSKKAFVFHLLVNYKLKYKNECASVRWCYYCELCGR